MDWNLLDDDYLCFVLGGTTLKYSGALCNLVSAQVLPFNVRESRHSSWKCEIQENYIEVQGAIKALSGSSTDT